MATRGRFLSLSLALAAGLLAALLLLANEAPAAAAQTGGVGIGIVPVDGTASENFTLPQSGSYYLTVATDDASSFVDASLTFNGSLMAQVNHSLGESSLVSLPAGTFTLTLAGHGRAALGWDLTNGSLQDFPDNQTLVGFLAPSGPRLHVRVALGDAQSIALRVYDDALLPAGNATVTASGIVDFVLPSLSASIAYVTASVTAGNPNGRFGISWTSEPLNPPIDFTAWPWFLLWILVPVAVAFAAFVLLHRRRGRRGGMP